MRCPECNRPRAWDGTCHDRDCRAKYVIDPQPDAFTRKWFKSSLWRYALLLLLAAPAHAGEMKDQNLSCAWGADTWSQVLVGQHIQTRAPIFGARLEASCTATVAASDIGISIFGRLDASGQADNPDTKPDFTSLKTYQSLEGYGGVGLSIFKPWLGPVFVYGQTFSVFQGGVDLSDKAQTIAGGLFVGRHGKGPWVYLLVGKHDPAGPGTKLLFVTRIRIVGNVAFVADVAFPGRPVSRMGISYRFW